MGGGLQNAGVARLRSFPGAGPSLAGALAVAAAGLAGPLASCGDAPATPAGSAPVAIEAPDRTPPAATAEGLPPRFAARREVSLPDKPLGLAAGDLDGDGRDELLAALESGELLLWPGGDPRTVGDGRPRGAPPRSAQTGGFPLGPRLLPADADGARLAAVASRATRELVLVDAQASVVRRVALPDVPRALAAGDLDADGAWDVVVATDGRRWVRVHEDGRVVEHALEGELPRCALVLSDGGGVVVGFQAQRALTVLATDGSPLASVDLGASDGIPRALLEHDADGDGDLELVVAAGDRSLVVLGAGAPGGAAAWIARPDPKRVEGDAIPIALAGGRPGARSGSAELVALFAADLSYGTWSARDGALERVDGGYAGQTPRSLALVDATGDGALDLVVANRDALALGLLVGAGDATFRPAPAVPVGRFPNGLLAPDLDGDGRADALTLDSKDAALSVLLGGAHGLRQHGRHPLETSPGAACAADLDGDGATDVALAVTDAGGARLVILRGDGRGGLERLPLDVPLGRSALDLLALDLDGDGRPEIVSADAEGDRVVWVPNETLEAGRLALGEPLAARVPSGPAALASLARGNGRAVAVALRGPGERTGWAVLRWHVDRLREETCVPLDASPLDVAGADADGDGLDDDVYLLANERYDGSTGLVQLFVADDDGTFGATKPAPTGTKPRHLAAGDLDGDGRDDVAVAMQNAHAVGLWLSRADDAAGARLVRLDDLGAGLGCLDVALADADGDGRLDVLVANAFTDDVTFARNEGP